MSPAEPCLQPDASGSREHYLSQLNFTTKVSLHRQVALAKASLLAIRLDVLVSKKLLASEHMLSLICKNFTCGIQYADRRDGRKAGEKYHRGMKRGTS